MHRHVTIADLFEPAPAQWGLRGDPYLWAEFRLYFATSNLPQDVALLKKQLEDAFVYLTGKSIDHAQNFHLEQFAHGGMSSGGICPEFWRESAILLLMRRYVETCAGN